MEPTQVTEVINLISSKIGVLAEKLEVPANQLLEIAVQGTRLTGITHGLLTLMLYGLTFIAYYIYKTEDDSENAKEFKGVLTIFFILASFIMTICFFDKTLLQIIAPEYSLLKELLNINQCN